MSDQPISLSELRAYLGPNPGRFYYNLPGAQVLALVEAVEAAQAVMWAAPEEDDDPEYHSLAAALARFTDHKETP